MITRYLHECESCSKHSFSYCDDAHNCGEKYWWYCDHCGIEMRLVFSDDGKQCLQTPTGKTHPRTLALFKMDSAPHIMFISRGMQVEGGNNEYFYHESTCPSNLLGCEQLIESGERDPHGMFILVKEVIVNDDNKADVLEELTLLAEEMTRA